MRTIDPRADLGTFTFLKNYARFRPEFGRRETYDEAIERMMEMHRTKFGEDAALDTVLCDIEDALKLKLILPSMRALQFGGAAILRKEMRLFNCSYSYFDRPEFLSEAVWLLLCGCGVGFSVQKHHVAKLPRISPPGAIVNTHYVEDSIEGWADAFKALFASYFGHNTVRFDYSRVRPEGSALSSTSAKAPGAKPLRDSLEAVRKLLDRVVADGGVIRPIDAYDMLMHAAMCVRAGGIRRSATIALFSPDDEDMMHAKTGNWFADNPQRRLSNNSALLVRATASEGEFFRLLDAAQSFGEPGFFFANSTEHGTNPCFSPDMRIATDRGHVRLRDVLGESLNVVTDARVTKDSVGQSIDGVIMREALPVRWTQTDADVFEVRTEHGHRIKATANHTFITTNGRKQLKDLTTEDVLLLPSGGTFGKDLDYNAGLVLGSLDEITSVPEKVFTGTRDAVRGYLHGLFAADGTVLLSGEGSGATASLRLSSIHEDMLLGVQTLLSSFGVVSRVYPRREAGDRSLPDGKGGYKDYPCAASYELVISRPNMITFAREIGLIGPKADRLHEVLTERGETCRKPERFISRVASIAFVGREDVMCLTEPVTNSVVVAGVVVGQCAEIGLQPVTDDGRSGWAMCNLTSVNVAACKTQGEFYRACASAAALGTLQAAYTATGYLGATTREILERDALLGVSLTGMADNPEVAFDADVLAHGAQIAIDVNTTLACHIGIRPAARVTTVKPEGTGSLVLGVGNGIHPHHSRRYLRHVEGGKMSDPIIAFIAKHIPEAVIPSAYAADEYKVVFPIDLGDGPAWLKAETKALDHLAKVKQVYEAWVKPGTTRGDLTHNVSNTIVVRPEEWVDVGHFVFENRDSFGGVAMLGSFGDLDYPQAPFVEVLSEEEIRVKYADDVVRATKALIITDFYRRLISKWVEVPWHELREDTDQSGGIEIVACAGGACVF